jgi:hypothetical protein
MPGWFPGSTSRQLLPEAVYLFGGSNSASPVGSITVNGSLGVLKASRQIAVICYGTNNALSTTGNTDSLTVDGVTANKLVEPGSGQVTHWTLWLTPRADDSGPTALTGDVVASRGSNFTTLTAVEVFALYHLSDPTAQLDHASVLTGNPASISLDTALDGVLIAMGRHFTSIGDSVWTGATEVDERNGGVAAAVRFGAAMENLTGAITGHTVELDHTNGVTNSAVFAASFR